MIVAGWGPARNVTISGNHFDGTTEYGHFCNGRSCWVVPAGVGSQRGALRRG